MKKEIKILEVAAVDGTVYFLLLPLMKELKAHGYNVEASCARGNFFDKIQDEGFVVHDIYISRSLNIFKHTVSIIKLIRLMKKKDYNIVHVHTPIGAFIGRVAARFANIPIVIYTIHGFYFHENMKAYKRKIIIFIERFLAKWTTFALSQSNEDTKLAIKERIYQPGKIVTIGNGVDINFFRKNDFNQEKFFNKRKKLNIPSDAVIVTCIARMNKEKGILDLIQVAKKVLDTEQGIHFVFVGGINKGNEPNAITEDFLKKFFAENPFLKRYLHFLGMRTDIKEILAVTDIFVLPSYREGMPRSIIEAMAMELPVVATNIRGSREEVIDGETGILVSPGDIDALSDAIIYLTKHPELRKIMGKKGRERAEKYFDERKVIEKQMNIIKRLVDGTI